MRSYYYESLENNQKQTYDAIVAGLKDMRASIPVRNTDKLADLLENITYDFVDFFYIDKRFNVSKGFRQGQFMPKYIYNKTQVSNLKNQIDVVANEIIVQCINHHQSEYDKVLVLHDYLKKHIQYDYDALESLSKSGKGFEDSFTIIGALLKHKCVCVGFALAMRLLCEKAGVECHIVTGIGNSSIFHGAHGWNLVRINGYYHHVDVTWDNQFSGDMEIPNYGYFCLDDETIAKDHTWNRKIYPPCPEAPYNYFRMNQSIMDSKTQLERYLYENMQNEEPLIMFKVQKGSPLEAEIAGSIDNIANRALSKCKHINVEQWGYQWMPDQLVYMMNVDYR